MTDSINSLRYRSDVEVSVWRLALHERRGEEAACAGVLSLQQPTRETCGTSAACFLLVYQRLAGWLAGIFLFN